MFLLTRSFWKTATTLAISHSTAPPETENALPKLPNVGRACHTPSTAPLQTCRPRWNTASSARATNPDPTLNAAGAPGVPASTPTDADRDPADHTAGAPADPNPDAASAPGARASAASRSGSAEKVTLRMRRRGSRQARGNRPRQPSVLPGIGPGCSSVPPCSIPRPPNPCRLPNTLHACACGRCLGEPVSVLEVGMSPPASEACVSARRPPVRSRCSTYRPYRCCPAPSHRGPLALRTWHGLL